MPSLIRNFASRCLLYIINTFLLRIVLTVSRARVISEIDPHRERDRRCRNRLQIYQHYLLQCRSEAGGRAFGELNSWQATKTLIARRRHLEAGVATFRVRADSMSLLYYKYHSPRCIYRSHLTSNEAQRNLPCSAKGNTERFRSCGSWRHKQQSIRAAKCASPSSDSSHVPAGRRRREEGHRRGRQRRSTKMWTPRRG